MTGHAEKCVERYCQLTGASPNQIVEVLAPHAAKKVEAKLPERASGLLHPRTTLEIGPPPQASSMQPERACVKSSKQKLKQQAAACWSHCQQALARDHHHDSFPAAAKQTFYPPLAVAINLPPAVAVPPLDLTSIKRHCPCSNFVCKHSNTLEKRAGTEPPLSCQLLPSERIGAMFTNPARAGVLGAHVLGSFPPGLC